MAKKSKRLLSAALAALMCAGSMGLSAFAGGGEATAEATFPIDKTANGLDANDQTDVTLTVPGTIEGNIDVVFVLGGGMANMKTIESAINVFKPAMESGKATVRMGLISLEKGKEIILDLNSDEAVLDPDTYVDFVTEKFDSINDLPAGTTNLHSQLLEAQKMLAKETKADSENKYVFVLATGRTYWFDDANGNQAMIIGKTGKLANGTGGTENFYYYGNYTWQSLRGGHSSLYMLPDKYNDSYEAFYADIEKWVADDGDKYVYSPLFDKDDYAAYENWYANNNADWRNLYNNGKGTRYGAVILNPKPAAENFISGTVAGIPYGENSHAMNYERAQYECIQVWNELIDDGYNCYSICSENPNYQNGSEYITQGAKYTGTSTTQVGHSFMNYLATLAGQTEAPTVWDYERDEDGNMLSTKSVLQENFFDSVRDDMLYTTSIDSTVVDYIGKNDNGNFEFIEEDVDEEGNVSYDHIKLNVGGVDYNTDKADEAKHVDKDGETAKSSYEFTAPGADEPTFWLDYYYGDGETTERFVWTFGENVSAERLASLTYKLQLTEKVEEVEEETKFIVPTNNSATLYPVDSDGKEGEPQVFPVPEVEYTVTPVVPYDVDIVLALGAGIAQYDADNAKYTHTYDSIVSLVEPLVNQGINVKLGLVAVEHYDDVAMELTTLPKHAEGTEENPGYTDIIMEGLNTIQSMPAGPTNLHGNIVAAKAMLDADKEVPAANKFFYVFATGRTYNYDNEDGVPTTIINKVDLKGSTYYYWGHYLWQSQRGRHTSLYMIPDKYNNDFSEYWKDVCTWVEADGDTYAYSFTDAYNPTNKDWYVGKDGFYTNNTKDAKALKLASSRFGWILNDLTGKTYDAIGSEASPAHALNYERAQYEAYKAYEEIAKAYNCYALCTESANYLNGSEYITLGAKYTGTSTIQLGHSFMNHLAKVDGQSEAPILFDFDRKEDGTLNSTAAVFVREDYFDGMEIDVDDLVETSEGTVEVPMMMAPAPVIPEVPALEIITQPVDAYGALGDIVTVSVEAQGEGLKYQWYFSDDNGETWSKSSIKTNTYEVEMTKARAGRLLYCKITDANGDVDESDIVALVQGERNLIVTQPVDAEGALGETVTVSVETIEEDGLKYQWYFSDNDGETFSKSSIKTNTYEVEMTKARAGRIVYCQVTDALGNTVKSDKVTLVQGERNLIVTQPVSAYGEKGESVSVAVETIEEDGLKYQWYIKDEGSSKFSKSSTKTAEYVVEMNKTRAGRELYCVVTDSYGNTQESDHVFLILGSTPIVEDEIPAEEPETGNEIPDPEAGNEIPDDEPIVLEG